MLERIADPQQASEVLMLRDQIRNWRFYDQFRVDSESPARRTQIGTYTPVLGQDGGDLAAALQTILEIGDAPTLASAISDAFPGSELEVRGTDGGLSVFLHQHGLLRPLSAAELSDGTLRYLLWAAALLTPRPPELMVLAVGAGSMTFSHVNDGGFWLVKEYFGMDIPQTLKTWTVVETGIAVMSITLILIVNSFV